jgi:hypothetical protein
MYDLAKSLAGKISRDLHLGRYFLGDGDTHARVFVVIFVAGISSGNIELGLLKLSVIKFSGKVEPRSFPQGNHYAVVLPFGCRYLYSPCTCCVHVFLVIIKKIRMKFHRKLRRNTYCFPWNNKRVELRF